MDQLTNELLGGGRKDTADPRVSQAMSTTSAFDALLSPEEIDQKARGLIDGQVLEEANTVLASGDEDTTEQLEGLADKFQGTPNADSALEAAATSLSSQEAPGRKTLMDERIKRVKVEQEYNRQQALARLRDHKEELDAEHDQATHLSEGGSILGDLVNNAGSVARTMTEFVDNYFLPGFYAEVINIAKDVAPELSGSWDYLQPEDTRRAVTKMILDLPPEKSKELVDGIFKSAHQRAGRLLSDNRLAEAHLLQEFLNPLEQGESKYNLSNWFAPLDYLFGAQQVKSGVKLGITSIKTSGAFIEAMTKFGPGSVPAVLSDLEGGAKNLLTAATGPNAEAATAAMGTNPGAVVGVLALPKPRIRMVEAMGPPAPIRSAPAVLPKELAGAKPRFSIGKSKYIPQFESDVDRALFIVSQAKKSKADAAYRAFLESTGMSTRQINSAAKSIRTNLKNFLKGKADGDIIVPALTKTGSKIEGFERPMVAMTVPAKAGESAPALSHVVDAAGAEHIAVPATVDHSMVGKLITPKVRVKPVEGGHVEVPAPLALPHGKPYLDEFFLDAAAKARKAAQIEQGLKDTFTLRLNDSIIEETEMGMNSYMRIGNGRGTGWVDPAEAVAWGKANLNIPFSVERDLTGTFQVQAQHFYAYGVDDVGAFLKPTTGIGIGKGSTMSEFIARGGTQAEILSSKAHHLNKEIAAAFTKLSGAKTLKVQETLIEGENLGKEFTRDELLLKNLTGDEIEGYQAIRNLATKVLKLKNDDMYQTLRAAGFNSTVSVDGGLSIIKLVKPESIGAEKLLDKSSRSINIATGEEVRLANLNLEDYKLFRFFEDSKSGYSYGILPKNMTPKTTQLPINVLKRVDGWMPRYYNAPYFIREIAANGHTTAVMTARSVKAAEKAIDELRAANPGKAYGHFESSAIAQQAGTVQDIAMMREQGLLFSSHRNPQALADAEGGVAALSVPDSVERLVSSASVQEGIGRWTIAMKQAFDKTYQSKLGFSMDLANPPSRPKNKALHAAYDEAMKVYNHVRLVNGLHSSQAGGNYVRAKMNKVADLFYNVDAAKNKSGRGMSGWFGDQVSGLNPSAMRLAKSAAFTAYIGLNPLVHAPLQMSMIPTYAGIRGATKYMARGQFFKDASVLQFSNDVAKLDTLRKRLGMTGPETEKLLADWRASGLQEMVDNHIMTVGTLGDGRVATAGAARKGAAAVFNFTKKIGFDVGVSADKRAAWLVARNRAIQDGVKLDATGLKKVAQDAEQITGGLNRSDPLYASDGVLSLFLQFMSHPIKMANRLVGGTVGSAVDVVSGGKISIAAETGLSRAEQARMGMASLMSYGFGGYGIHEAVERWNTKNGWNLPEPVKLLLQEGIIGAAFNTALQTFYGDDTKVQFSSKFSPFTTAGTILTNSKEIGKIMLSMDFDALQEFIPNPAALGFLGSMLDSAIFFGKLAGKTDLSIAEDAQLTATASFVRKFPITNNLLKAHMAYNMGYKFDSRGKPTVEATKGEAIAALWGLRSYEEYAVQRGNLAIYGTYKPLDERSLTGHLKGAVQDTLAWMIPTLTAMGEGKIDLEEASKMIDSHNLTFMSGLDPAEYAQYRNLLSKAILKTGVTKTDSFVNALSKKIASGEIAPTASLRDRMYGLEFEGKEHIIPTIERMFNDVETE